MVRQRFVDRVLLVHPCSRIHVAIPITCIQGYNVNEKTVPHPDW